VNHDLITTIDLLRHGALEGGECYRGSLDDPLSEHGWEQMRSAIGEYHAWDVIISSPLRRCADFSRELSELHGLPLEIAPELREMSFGAWEGHTSAAIGAITPQTLHRFWNDPMHHPPPGGESLQDFANRVVRAWEVVLTRHLGRHLLIVTHGGVIRIVLCHVLEMPLKRLWRLEVPYATVSRVRLYGQMSECQPTLVFHGKGLE
jgi:alpha-ribazole phosphatase/probable phosphoglycerate mutase